MLKNYSKMKKRRILFTTILIITLFSCKAQIVPLDTRISSIQDGSYVKDINNELDNFIGTWVYSNANKVFTITIQKQVHTFNGKYYQDYLIGEYAYTINGITIIDTLSELPDETDDDVDESTEDGLTDDNTLGIQPQNVSYNLGGRYIVTGPDHSCTDCAINERRIDMYFVDPERKYLSTNLFLRYLVGETSPEKITATIRARSGTVTPLDGFDSPRVPYGTYLMEKQ